MHDLHLTGKLPSSIFLLNSRKTNKIDKTFSTFSDLKTERIQQEQNCFGKLK